MGFDLLPISPRCVTLCYKIEDEQLKTHVIDPVMLAAISPLFRDILSLDSSTLELNEQGFLSTNEDVECFLEMCGCPMLFWEKRNKPSYHLWNYTSFYAASRLCDSMGIIAKPILHLFNDTLFTVASYRVVFHQITLRTNNNLDKKYIERIILQAWQLEQNMDKEEDYEVKEEEAHGKLESVSLHNDTLFALHNLYYKYSVDCLHGPESELTAADLFMRTKLGSNLDGFDQYVYCIRYNKNFLQLE